MKYKAVIWDMDGVLVDTGDLHYRSWRDISRTFGYEYTREQFDKDFGMKNPDILKRMMGEDTPPSFIKKFCDRKEDLFLEMIRGKIEPMQGVVPILDNLRERDIPMAVASSSPMRNINTLLNEMGISSYFDAILSVGDLPGKPDPAVFLEAAGRLDTPPKECVVFEDSIAGVAAARAGSMTCIAITSTNPAELLSQADLIIDRYEDLPNTFFS